LSLSGRLVSSAKSTANLIRKSLYAESPNLSNDADGEGSRQAAYLLRTSRHILFGRSQSARLLKENMMAAVAEISQPIVVTAGASLSYSEE
jgi:hypothetical protein